MSKYKNKLVYNKLKYILSSNQLILIGQYNSNHEKLWKDFKTSNSFYIPKNSLCKIIINELTSNKLQSNEHNCEENLFNGPVFFIYTNQLEDKNIFQALTKIKNAGILIYGGFLNGKLINFEDVQEIISLLKNDLIYQKPYQNISLTLIHMSQLFSGINYKLVTQFNNYKNRS